MPFSFKLNGIFLRLSASKSQADAAGFNQGSSDLFAASLPLISALVFSMAARR